MEKLIQLPEIFESSVDGGDSTFVLRFCTEEHRGFIYRFELTKEQLDDLFSAAQRAKLGKALKEAQSAPSFYLDIEGRLQGMSLESLARLYTPEELYATYTGKGGHQWQRDKADATFVVGGRYKVTSGKMHGCHTTLVIEGVPGEWNSVLFDVDHDHPCIENMYIGTNPE